MAGIRNRLEGAVLRGVTGLPAVVRRAVAGRPVQIDGQDLHLEAQFVLRLLALAGEPPRESVSVHDARSKTRRDAAAFAGRPLPDVEVVQTTVAGANGELPARLYVPDHAPTPSGLLVYFHGGGFVVCDLDTHDQTCRFMAREAGVRVVSVDYRLAPEHPFPAAADDALAAFRHIAGHAGEFGAAPRRLAVGGDSAGGNLAAGIAQAQAQAGILGEAEDQAPALQLLFYPWLDLSAQSRSYDLFGKGFFLTTSQLDWYRRHYLANFEDARDPRCSPLLAADLHGVAPAYIATAGFDPLRDEGELYARALSEAGVRVALRRHRGLIHGFANMVATGHAGREALLEAAGALRICLATPGDRQPAALA